MYAKGRVKQPYLPGFPEGRLRFSGNPGKYDYLTSEASPVSPEGLRGLCPDPKPK